MSFKIHSTGLSCENNASTLVAIKSFCQVILGRMRIYFEAPLNNSSESQKIEERFKVILQQGMNNNDLFIPSNAAIVRVKLLDLSQEDKISISAHDEEYMQNPAFESRIPIYAWIVLSCVIIFVLATIQRCKERRNYKDLDGIENQVQDDHTQFESRDAPLPAPTLSDDQGEDLSLEEMEEETIVSANTKKSDRSMLQIVTCSDRTMNRVDNDNDEENLWNECSSMLGSCGGKSFWK